MKNAIILFTLTIAIHQYLSAQIELAKPWTFSLGVGMAAPVGTYGKNDAPTAAVYAPNVPNPWIIGLNKTKSGFAKTGYYYNADLRYNFTGNIAFFIRTGQCINSVDTKILSNFLTELDKGTVAVEHVNYDIFYFTPGIEYYKTIKNFNVGLNLFTGLAQCKYPYYKWILLYTTTDPPIYWAHEGARPNLNALIIGSSLDINYKITSNIIMGFEAMYQRANFKYEMRTRAIPGGSNIGEIHDTVKLATVNIGFKIGYKF